MRRTVLVVDDDAATCRLYAAFLDKDHDVVTVDTGVGAVELVEKQPVDLVIMDLNMPGLDGRKTLEAIKSNANWRTIPVVILTTSDDERDIEGCYALGANTYVQKPVDLDGLFAAIQRLKEYWFEIAILPLEG